MEDLAVRQMNMLRMAEGVSRFGAVMPLLLKSGLTGRRLGIFTASCAAGALITSLAERRMKGGGCRAAAGGKYSGTAAQIAVFWLFAAQVPATLYFAADIMAFYRAGAPDGVYPAYAFLFLPFLISAFANALFRLRRSFMRLYRSGWHRCGAAAGELLWGLFAASLTTLAAGFRDRYAAAGFYCAYGWQALPGLLLLIGAVRLAGRIKLRHRTNDC